MEASEHARPSREECGGSNLQRIDPGRVREQLHGPDSGMGYARLALMLDTILPRLTGEPEKRGTT